MVLALNTVSGQISDVSPKTLLHPKFKDILVPVDKGTKPYNPVMYKPGTVEEKSEQRSGLFSFMKKEEEEQEPESNIDIEEEN
tara:strand:- start:748 stop:996 length:249 start_codon:yes stop_codon:yes gene_type:complete